MGHYTNKCFRARLICMTLDTLKGFAMVALWLLKD
jgi:hypothetical protein